MFDVEGSGIHASIKAPPGSILTYAGQLRRAIIATIAHHSEQWAA